MSLATILQDIILWTLVMFTAATLIFALVFLLDSDRWSKVAANALGAIISFIVFLVCWSMVHGV